MKTLDVVSICNALVDILVKATDKDITTLGLNKGIMHLVDDERQQVVINHFKSTETTKELGGSSMNAIRTLAQLGAKTSFAGTVGKDSYGELISSRMKSLGIASHIQNAPAHTGLCFILVTPDGERTMNTSLGASCLYDDKIVPHDDIKAAKIFHFSGYQWANETQINAIKKALATAKEAGTLISFDLADPFVVRGCRQEFIKVIEDYADIVFANREEAELLYESTPEVAANKIAAAGAIAAVKLGAEGALIAKGSERYAIKPVATNVIDTTGAGDMFASGFLYGITKGLSLEVSGKIAATLASDVISRLGASVSAEGLAKAKAL
ncbi:MAG: adenosine kinase [Proteobacteria bacterium]|nr:MAG: adenosine kinase [Pseudomonadota bacterium]